jgi:predicted nucleic acid-binding Zn ribbon protein
MVQSAMTHDDNNARPSRVSDILTAIFKDRGWNKVVREHRVFDEWDGVVGAIIAKNARPIRIDRGVLVAIVSSPVWTQELSLMKETIIGRLNDRLGEPVILDIRFIQGEMPDNS